MAENWPNRAMGATFGRLFWNVYVTSCFVDTAKPREASRTRGEWKSCSARPLRGEARHTSNLSGPRKPQGQRISWGRRARTRHVLVTLSHLCTTALLLTHDLECTVLVHGLPNQRAGDLAAIKAVRGRLISPPALGTPEGGKDPKSGGVARLLTVVGLPRHELGRASIPPAPFNVSGSRAGWAARPDTLGTPRTGLLAKIQARGQSGKLL